jgi:hypothetical protein
MRPVVREPKEAERIKVLDTANLKKVPIVA